MLRLLGLSFLSLLMLCLLSLLLQLFELPQQLPVSCLVLAAIQAVTANQHRYMSGADVIPIVAQDYLTSGYSVAQTAQPFAQPGLLLHQLWELCQLQLV